MSDNAHVEQGVDRHAGPPPVPYKKYIYIPPVVQHLMTAVFGALLAAITGYTLRRLGY
jgi:hypothetical protein